MKKFLTLSLAAMAVMATSCSDETGTELKTGGESTVTFTTTLPELGTRAFGEATKVQSLKYAVYEQGSDAPLAMFEGAKSKTEAMTALTKNVTLKLTTGKTYDVIFWASSDAVDATSKFNETTKTATIAPTVNNNEADDAFYAKATVAVTGNSQQTVELYRPYAQINIGTDDYASAAASGYTVTQTQLKMTAYGSINLSDGTVSNPTAVTYTMADIPSASEAGVFPAGTTYKYLSMTYALVPMDKTVADITFDYTNGTTQLTRTFANVPVQRNYRTNIYGSLLTSTTDFNVVIVPGFTDPDYNHNVITASTQTELATAAQTPNAVIKLQENTTYTLPATVAEGVTFSGDETTVISIPQAIAYHGKTIGFSGVTVESPNANYTGIQHAKSVTYTGCVIEGSPFSYAEKAVYNSCTFKQTSSEAYNIWTYGSKDITFNSCKFECAGRSVLIYNEGDNLDQKATFNNCEFIASAPVEGKAAIEVDTSLIPGTYVVNINNCTATGFGTGTKSGNSLWNVKKDNVTEKHSQVFVDGTQVY